MSEKRPIGTRADYRWFTTMPTRWMDNDVFGHVNNVVYYSWIDTAVAEFLLQAGMYGDRTLNLDAVPAVGLVVASGLVAFSRHDDEVVISLLGSISGRDHVIGGSVAQRDVIELTVAAAAERSGRHVLARSLASSRLARQPGSPAARRVAERLGLGRA